jgi:hypothetical protein
MPIAALSTSTTCRTDAWRMPAAMMTRKRARDVACAAGFV